LALEIKTAQWPSKDPHWKSVSSFARSAIARRLVDTADLSGAGIRAEGLLLGWAAGVLWGSWTSWSNGLKPPATIDLSGAGYSFYVGLGALILNIAVAAVGTVIVAWVSPKRRRSVTSPS
jgi:hypothetical protein